MTEDNAIAHAFQAVTDATQALNKVGTDWPGELSEVFNGMELQPEVFAQILMEHLPHGKSLGDDKMFWLAVMTHMGPDWIQAFRHVGAFMAKMDEF